MFPLLIAKIRQSYDNKDDADFDAYIQNNIKEIAKQNNIEIVENKPLARMLYYNVEIGDQTPPELYQMVAEVLAYVYSVKNKEILIS